MARSHSSSTSQSCNDAIAGYMDGVHVKITDLYRVPRVRAPPAYYAKLPPVEQFNHDFGLERAALEKMKEWKRTRTAYISERKARLEEKRKKTSSPPSSPKSILPQQLTSVNNNSNGLDYSDFDNDTSSPFDNMELKTINEMEELAQVLQSSNAQWNQTSPTVENTRCLEEKRKAVSNIMDDLKKEIEKINVVEVIKKPQSTNREAQLLAGLSKEDTGLAKHLSDMGFPLSRVARAVRDFKGQDDKNIVEYLLAVQSLEDLGMSEEAACKALALTQYDKHKAKAYHESLCMLRDLGFPEDKASKALLKCNIDRDSALDLLIA